MRLSIITATYNAEVHIAALADSLNQQGYTDFEWVIADGGSSDGTLNVSRLFRGNIQIISESDNGIYDAWNKAVKVAKGEWLIFLGADDCLVNADSLGNLARNLPENGYNLAFFPTRLKSGWRTKDIPSVVPSEVSIHLFEKTMNYCHQGVAQKRADLMQNGIFDSRFKVCGDYDAMLSSLKKMNGVYLQIDPIAIMVLGGISTTIRGIGLAYSEMTVIQKKHFGKSNRVLTLKSYVFLSVAATMPKFFCDSIESLRNARIMMG